MKIINFNPNQPRKTASKVAEVLQNGGLVIYPTETVYGVGVDATNSKAVEKLLHYKSRREGKPLSIAVANIEMAKNYVELTEQAKKMYKNFLPGPYTIVSTVSPETEKALAPGVKSEFNTLGIRIPDYKLVIEIIQNLKKPITATSANASGKKRPYTIQDVLDNISEKQKSLIDLIVDAGELPRNKPSTVVDTTLSTPLVVREGGGKNENKENLKIQKLTTHSPQETQDLAGKILLKYWDEIKETGLVIGLNGKLGAGKTIFTKGLAKFLKITDTVTSPTYVYHLEYPYQRHNVSGFLHHLDVWKIDNKSGFELLEIDKLIKPGNLVVIEWWQQIEKFWKAPSKTPVVKIFLEETGENQRNIEISLEQND